MRVSRGEWPRQKKWGTSRTEAKAGSGGIKNRRRLPQRRKLKPMMTLQGPASKMTGFDAHPQLKAKKRPRFCSSQKSEIPGVIGGSGSCSSFLLAFFSLYTTE